MKKALTDQQKQQTARPSTAYLSTRFVVTDALIEALRADQDEQQETRGDQARLAALLCRTLPGGC